MGAVLHTVNPRLFPGQIAFILADAEDTHLFVYPTLLGGAEALADQLPASLRTIVVMGEDADIPADCPLRGRFEVVSQEALIAGQPSRSTGRRSMNARPPRSATPRAPRASRRACCTATAAPSSTPSPLQKDASISAPPMWCCRWCRCSMRTAGGSPIAAAVAGASLVLPGPQLDPASLHRLFEEEGVTFSAGVPTIWTALLDWLRADPARRFAIPPRLVVGGTALPTAINAGFRSEYGVSILHAWGMTETSPLGTTNARKPENAAGTRTASSAMPASRAAHCSASNSGCATAPARDSRATAWPSASWRCAAPGSPAPISTAPAMPPSPPMAGSAPATW